MAEKVMDSPLIYFYRGVIYNQMGYVQKAKDNLERFLNSDCRDNEKIKIARSMVLTK